MEHSKIFSPKVIENILLNLNGRDLLTCSLVCSSWSDIIGSSERCMNKLKLIICGEDGSRKATVEGLKSLTRKYQHIVIYQAMEFIYPLYDLMNSNRGWKTVNIRENFFPSTSSFAEFMETIEPTVEELTMYKVDIEYQNHREMYFRFEKLKSLNIEDCAEPVAVDPFRRCTSLASFKFIDSEKIYRATKGITKMLCSQQEMKVLSLELKRIDISFYAEVNFAYLEELTIANASFSDDAYETFLKFLKRQTSIKKLQLKDITCRDYLNQAFIVVLEMPSIKEFSSSTVPLLRLMNLPINGTLEILDFSRVKDYNSIKDIKCFLNAVPNLREITLRDVSENLAKFIAMTNVRLTQVTASSIENDEVTAILPNVKFVLPKEPKGENMRHGIFSSLVGNRRLFIEAVL